MSINASSNNQSGIHSLAGFAYQIRVFAFFALQITKDGETVEFETIDDVGVQRITNKILDNKADSFMSKTLLNNANQLVQVKRTSLAQADFNKTLFNWILQYNRTQNISNYILFSDISYTNSDLMFNVSAEDLFDLALSTQKTRSDAIEVQIKDLYADKFDEFKTVYNDIKDKYKFIGNQDIDILIFEQAKHELRYINTNTSLYKERLKHFMQSMENKILYTINKKEPYILIYPELIKIYEDINTGINNEHYYPPYYSYKKGLNNLSLSDTEIIKLRETNQLIACSLPENSILERLKRCMYYEHFRNLSMENGNESKPKEIEETTYYNFNSVLDEISGTNKDFPKTRLIETEKRQNNHTKDDEIRTGSCIFMTKENVNNQISWKDDKNAND